MVVSHDMVVVSHDMVVVSYDIMQGRHLAIWKQHYVKSLSNVDTYDLCIDDLYSIVYIDGVKLKNATYPRVA